MGSCRVHTIRFYNITPKAINCMCYEPESRKLALSRSDNSVEIWDMMYSPNIEKMIPGGEENSIEALVWCNNRLFSTGLHGFVIEYDLLKLCVKSKAAVTASSAWCLAINKKKSYLAAGTEDGFVNIFSITDEGLQYEKVLDRQEGRIMCIAWDSSGEFIVTGSAGTLRIWNVESGHPVRKMNMGRREGKFATLVWCIVVFEDFTIAAGDSRGVTTFWNGQNGSMVESLPCHKADVLALCIDEKGTGVYAAGVDPVICNFTRVEIRKRDSQKGRSKWIKSVQRRVHDHDVKALVMAENRLVSGGADGSLTITRYPPKVLLRYPPLLQPPCASLAPEAKYIMLRHLHHLEVWKLGASFKTEGEPDETLALSHYPVKLLELKSKHEEHILCCGISNDAQWIGYSTDSVLRFYRFSMNEDTPHLEKLSDLPSDCGPSYKMLFLNDNMSVVIATKSKTIQVIKLHQTEPEILLTINPYKKERITDSIHHLAVTVINDRSLLVVADNHCNIGVWSLKTGKFKFSLPKYNRRATALAIHPKTNNLVIAYADQKIVEYNLCKKVFTKFSEGLESKHPKQWLARQFAISNIVFDPRNDDVIILQDDNMICVINKNKELPECEAKIPRLHSSGVDSVESSQSSQFPKANTPDHAFSVCKKYKHVVFIGSLGEDEFVIVEVNPTSLIEKLPPVLQKKRYGM